MDTPIHVILIIIVVSGGINAFIAKLKGFNPILWFFTAGFLGLIVVALLPSAKKVEEGTEEYNQRRARANWWGYVILVLAAVFVIIQIITFLA
jgi:uncharacterized membrane protein YdcZ (DUF606 family)